MVASGEYPSGVPTRTLYVEPMGADAVYSTKAVDLLSTTCAVDVALSELRPEKPDCLLR